MVEEAKPRLGRGLAALLGSAREESDILAQSRGQRRLPIESIRANPRNPRIAFIEADLVDLADSIREKGILQPILVRNVGGERYEIIAGERRWRAAQRAGLHEVPVVVVEATDKEALELAIIENVQRADLNPLEEAAGYERLLAEFDYTHNDLGRVIGKSRSHVANTVRLLKLSPAIQAHLSEGRISAGHARALLAIPDDADAAAERIVAEGLSVREIEELGRKPNTPGRGKSAGAPVADADTQQLEQSLQDALGLAVKIVDSSGKGEVRIRYANLEQLDLVISRLKA